MLRIQLKADICTDKANPIAVAGKLNRAKKELVRFFWDVIMGEDYVGHWTLDIEQEQRLSDIGYRLSVIGQIIFLIL